MPLADYDGLETFLKGRITAIWGIAERNIFYDLEWRDLDEQYTSGRVPFVVFDPYDLSQSFDQGGVDDAEAGIVTIAYVKKRSRDVPAMRLKLQELQEDLDKESGTWGRIMARPTIKATARLGLNQDFITLGWPLMAGLVLVPVAI